MKKKGWSALTRFDECLLICTVFAVSAANAMADFGAYYTKINSGQEFERYSRTGPYADIVVRGLGEESGRLVFWRGSSYLPYWEVNGKKWFLEELTERSGDGPANRPDNVNSKFVDEYFIVFPDGKVARGFRPGTEKFQQWVDPKNVSTQWLELTERGIAAL